MAKITTAQREILERQGVAGIVFQYQTKWIVDGQPVTRIVNGLIKRGLMKSSYYANNQCSAWITDAGRELLTPAGRAAVTTTEE